MRKYVVGLLAVMILQRESPKHIISPRTFIITFRCPLSPPTTNVSVYHIRFICVTEALEVLSKGYTHESTVFTARSN
jgi:hypothetical protein